MNPALNAALVDAVLNDRLRQAARETAIARARRAAPSEPTPFDNVTVRRAQPRDAAAIRRLADLEGRSAPEEPLLVAEVDGTVLAARSLEARQTVADPFRPTGQLVELLDLRSLHLRAELELEPRASRLRRAMRSLAAPLR